MMEYAYKRITLEERKRIAALLSEGYTVSKIARALKRNKSTISRELARNSEADSSYVVENAQQRAKENAMSRRKGKRK